jgi:GT2 family glycosyltransferase
MNEVLVVIPTIVEHNRKYHLLDQLAKEWPVKRVLMVDNGNCFALPVPLEKRERWSKLHRIRPGCNMNWLHSCNLGAAVALEQRIPYVCFLNDDVKLSWEFFENILEAFRQNPDAAVVVPQYNGQFGPEAHNPASDKEWQSRPADIPVPYVDGTCMVLSLNTLRTVGFLDPSFRHPGWGADVDYSHRVALAGQKLYVTQRAMLWHQTPQGGTSAIQIYGGRREWVERGQKQAQQDLEAKYGPNWREILPWPPGVTQNNLYQTSANR